MKPLLTGFYKQFQSLLAQFFTFQKTKFVCSCVSSDEGNRSNKLHELPANTINGEDSQGK